MSDIKEQLDNLKLNENENEDKLYGYFDKNKSKSKNPQTITLKLIMDRNYPLQNNDLADPNVIKEEEELNNDSSNLVNKSVEDALDLKAKRLLKLTHIYLDREQIGEIDNLAEYLHDVTHLYLQHNLIKKIENLDFLKNLTFLVISNNQISQIENIKLLTKLKLLDLSSNLIETIDVRELPLSIVFLDLRENNFFKNGIWYINNYSEILQKYLVNLKQLNGDDLIELEKEENSTNAFKNSSDENIENIQQQILNRSMQRQKKDVLDFENIWQKKKSNLKQIQESVKEKFGNF